MSDSEETKSVAAVERAFSVLEAFRDGDALLSLAQLAERTGLYKSTILRLLLTLERLGYIGRTAAGDYHIGPAPLRLGRLYQSTVRPEGVITPALQNLVNKTGESASFHVRLNDRRLCLYRIDSPQIVRDHYMPGDELPLDRGAGGVILTAFSEPFDPAYAKERENLAVISRGSLNADMAGVAAPVFDAEGKIVGALTLSGPATRFGDEAAERFRTLLIDTARQVTTALGGDTRPFDRVRDADAKGIQPSPNAKHKQNHKENNA
ncbi:MAG: IclR family transcriptional regulator [Noviherbaspirillum sp.]|jgi:DNA-binding IclR family transcriptional regulator|nr:IclR family transcriptional regulator [Noviherbaspirillum sp.]